MNTQENIILEIAVDRQNEKGVFDVLFSEEKKFFSKKRKHPQFRFFLVHIGGRIRFFFEVPTKYREFFESQLYAHYNNIEITESSLPFAENQEFFTQE